jgi:hypothetical protein
MPDHGSQFTAALVAAMVIFAVYRRFRRNFGRQSLRVGRLRLRIGLFVVIGLLTASVARQGLPFLAGIALGVAAGVMLALWGASQTRFERDGTALYYVPHTYTGVLVSLLFLGRLTYRLVQGYPAPPSAGGGSPFAAYVRSPLTVGLFFVLVGYYVCYYSLVLWKSREVRAEASGLAGSGSPLTGDSSNPAETKT